MLSTLSAEKTSWSKLHSMLFLSFLLVCIALGTGLRVLWVGPRELWYDEAISVLLASGQKDRYQLPDDVPFALSDFSQLLTLPAEKNVAAALETVKAVVKSTLSDPHPPLFYLSEHGWMRLFGSGEVALRSLVLLVSLATLIGAYGLGQRILGQRGGLIFTALLALNPFFLDHSLNLRMYAPMLFWVVVSGWCLLALIEGSEAAQPKRRSLLRVGLAVSLAAGLLTQYLFAYWFFAVAALILYLEDRKRWFQHSLTLAAAILLFTPWALWGTRQQVHNRQDVLSQISSVGGPLQAAFQHGQDLAQTLGDHLLLGHLTTDMLPVAEPIKPTAVAIGWAVVGFVGLCVVGLYRRHQYRVLMIAVLMGLLPLAIALAVDVIANTYTLGFGWGRSVMVALPGCLLLIAAWLELATGRWREPLTAALLAAYLTVNIADLGMRDRQMFTTVNSELISTNEPTLVVMNSRAWGHVLRLIYYLDNTANAEVLVADPANVSAALTTALAAKDYERILWLKSEYPLWGEPKTQDQAQALIAETESILQEQSALQSTQTLSGTMKLDHFELQVYR